MSLVVIRKQNLECARISCCIQRGSGHGTCRPSALSRYLTLDLLIEFHNRATGSYQRVNKSAFVSLGILLMSIPLQSGLHGNDLALIHTVHYSTPQFHSSIHPMPQTCSGPRVDIIRAWSSQGSVQQLLCWHGYAAISSSGACIRKTRPWYQCMQGSCSRFVSEREIVPATDKSGAEWPNIRDVKRIGSTIAAMTVCSVVVLALLG